MVTGSVVLGQNPRRQRRNNATQNVGDMDTSAAARAKRDSIRIVTDSIRVADSTARADSVNMLHKSSLNQPAFSAAKDSMKQTMVEGHRKMYYWGDVTVTYGNMKLTADYMEYDVQSGVVFAKGTYDSLTGTWKGQPVMTQGGQTFNMEDVQYNFNTQKALIHNMITQQDDGILHGHNIKMMPDKSINITNGQYTVCDLEHPHYYLKLYAAKVMTKPSQRTVFGPAHLVVEDIDLPLALPFGFIPKRPNRATGLLMPSFGEENARGFYMRDAGMYFDEGCRNVFRNRRLLRYVSYGRLLHSGFMGRSAEF